MDTPSSQSALVAAAAEAVTASSPTMETPKAVHSPNSDAESSTPVEDSKTIIGNTMEKTVGLVNGDKPPDLSNNVQARGDGTSPPRTVRADTPSTNVLTSSISSVRWIRQQEEDQARRERKLCRLREEQEKNCGTFTPKLYRRAKDSPTLRGQERLLELHRSASKKEEHLQKRREAESLSLKRRLRPKSYTKNSIYHRPASNNRRENIDAVEQLFSEATRRERRLREESERVLKQECSFKPKTNDPKKKPWQARPFKPRFRRRSESPQKKGSSQVASRLYDLSLQRARELELEKKRKKQEIEGCTFSPSVNNRGAHSKQARESVGTRLYNAGKRSAEKLKATKIRLEQEEHKKCTFQPAVLKKVPSRIAKRLGRRHVGLAKESVHRRLYDDGKLYSAKRKKETDLSLAQACTFKPAIDPISDALATSARQAKSRAGRGTTRSRRNGRLTDDNHGESQENGDSNTARLTSPVTRAEELYEHGRLQQERRRLLKDYKLLAALTLEERDRKECTFQPKVRRRSKGKDKGNRVGRDGPSPDLFERLYNDAAERREREQEAMIRAAEERRLKDELSRSSRSERDTYHAEELYSEANVEFAFESLSTSSTSHDQVVRTSSGASCRREQREGRETTGSSCSPSISPSSLSTPSSSATPSFTTSLVGRSEERMMESEEEEEARDKRRTSSSALELLEAGAEGSRAKR